VNVIGHPTGRLVNGRAGLPLDFAPIFKRAAETGTALEINASYQRLDLNDVHARGAIEAGCLLCINTDAHQPRGLGKLAGGIGTARRAWTEAKHVVNCMNVAQLKKFVAKKRK
jgi:DNA polymerase (family 10)